MKILVASGAFKQSLSAAQACATIAAGLRESGLDARIDVLPIADGGNGTLDAFLATGGERVAVQVFDPLLRPIEAEYGLVDEGQTAVIEMALASGLELLQPEELNPLIASTYGAGQLMADALDRGAERIVIGLGGSATVDGGMGCMSALGVRISDASGNSIGPGGAGLADIDRIDTSGLDPRWGAVDVIIASDVENPTLEEQGAARVFGPQKGADQATVEVLEDNLRHCFGMIHEQMGVDLRKARGGGAAGAFAAGLMAFLRCELVSGIDLVLRHHGFVERLADCGLVITGEGQMDSQTLDGKGPIGVAQVARDNGVPTVALAGGLNIDDRLLHEAGIQAAFSIVDGPMTLAAALENAETLLWRAARRLGYALQLSLSS